MKNILSFLKDNKKLRVVVSILLITIYTFVFCFSFSSGVLTYSEAAVDDDALQQGVSCTGDIFIVEITKEDIEYFACDASEIAAKVASRLNESSNIPAAIGLDIPLNTMTDRSELILQTAALKSNLVIPVSLSVGDHFMIDPKSEDTTPIGIEYVNLPDSTLMKRCDTAHILKITDGGGVLRHAVFDLVDDNGTVYQSMPTVCYKKFCNANGIEYVEPALSAQNTAVIKFVKENGDESRYSAREILEGNYDSNTFADKIVYIGYFDNNLDQGYITGYDYDSRLHTSEIDAHITNNLISNNLALNMPMIIQIAILAVCVSGMAIYATKCTLLGGIAVCIMYEILVRIVGMLLFGVGYACYTLPHMINAPLTMVLFAVLSYSYRNYLKGKRLENVLGRYIDIKIAKDIFSTGSEHNLENYKFEKKVKSRKIAVLFADIRDFTSISEALPAESLVVMLNEYLSMMADCVKKYGGTLDKFIGDCAMAYWGAPTPDDDPVYHACLCAAEIQRRSVAVSNELKRMTGRDIQIGIGINYGDAVVGSIGSEDRMNFTAVGDTVNTASRLEALAPGGEIYISEAANNMLGKKGETEILPMEINLKGKEHAIPVYSLKNISVSGKREKFNPKKQAESNFYRRKAIAAMIVSFIAFFMQFFILLNSLRTFGIEYLSYFTLTLSALSGAAMLVLIPYDRKDASDRDGINIRPMWLDVWLLSAVIASSQCLLSFTYNLLPIGGNAAFASLAWPGGIVLHIVCPILTFIIFILLENKATYEIKHVIIAIHPLVALLIISSIIARRVGLNTLNPVVYNFFYKSPKPLLIVFAETIISFLFYYINKKNRLQEKMRMRSILKAGGHVSRLTNSKFGRWYVVKKNKYWLYIIISVIIGVLSIRTTIYAYSQGGIRAFSNPSLNGVIIFICSVAGIACYVSALLHPEGRIPGFYRYISFARNLGCSINFFTVLLVAVSGEGIAAFFTPRWSADATVFLLCPILAVIILLMEGNDFKLPLCFLTAIPFAAMPVLSKTVIDVKNVRANYAYEIENFYTTGALVAIIIAIFIIVIPYYFLNYFVTGISRQQESSIRGVNLSVCGCRSGINGGANGSSEYGLDTSCYVIRDGEYGIVFGCGTGLSGAIEKLKGCSDVDIILNSNEFTILMGLLVVPNVCPEAKIRIITPFNLDDSFKTIDAFAAKPYWPVNIIQGECVSVVPERKFRLNVSYAVEFIPNENNSFCYMVKLSGNANVFFTNTMLDESESLKKAVDGTDMILYDARGGYKEACYFAIDTNIPNLVITGYPAEMLDETIKKMEDESVKLLSSAKFAKEKEEYPIR